MPPRTKRVRVPASSSSHMAKTDEEKRATKREYMRKWRATHLDLSRKHARNASTKSRVKKNAYMCTWKSRVRSKGIKFGSGHYIDIIKRLLMERDKGICQICGEPVALVDASHDHLIPRSRGGTNEPSNVRLAHLICNIRKGIK